MTTGAQIASKCLEWLGVPWQHQGRSTKGVDCVGLVVEVAKELGYSPEDKKGYARSPKGDEFVAHFEKQAKKIPFSEVKPGDILVFTDVLYPSHCAFYVEINGLSSIVHAHATRRKVLQEELTKEWRGKVRGVFRISDEA